MVESTGVALRLLELIALLFPVVALLLQLQHRVDSSGLGVIGGVVGTGLAILLSLSFFLVALYLVVANTLSSLLAVSIGIIALTGFLVPVLVVLSLRGSIEVESDVASNARTTIRTIRSQMRQFYREIYRRWR